MSQNNFLKRKKEILAKLDKSSIGKWDKKIVSLCNKINGLGDFYTTSSCAGRIVLIVEQDKKENGLFLKVYHDLISLKLLKGNLEKIRKKKVVFKQEPPILHVACKNVEGAFEVLGKARTAGWKRSGIISKGSRYVVELMSTEKLEFPIIREGKILVDGNFLKIIIEKSNENLKKGWEKIDKLKEIILYCSL